MKKLANKIETYQVTDSIHVDVMEGKDNNEDVLSFKRLKIVWRHTMLII